MGAIFLIGGAVLVCVLINVLCRIWLLALGFRRHWGWGCALLVQLLLTFVYFGATPAMRAGFVPAVGITVAVSQFLILAFIIVAWNEAKTPFFWLIGSTCVCIAIFCGAAFYAVESSAKLKAAMEAQGVPVSAFDQLTSWRPGSSNSAQPKSTSTGGAQSPAPGGEDRGQPPMPSFQSRLPPRQAPPGERESPSPGIYYLLERVTSRTPHGVQHGLPGEKVILLNRLPGGKMRVTVGNADFEVNASQVTDDIDAARQAEKNDFMARGGKL